MEDRQPMQAPQAEGQRARPVNRAQAGVRRRQRAAAAAAAAAAAEQEEQQAAASDESGASEVALTCSQSSNNKACMLCFSAVQLPAFKLSRLFATG